MAKSVVPKGKTRVCFNIPDDLLEQLKERAEAEKWNQTVAIVEAIKEFLK